MKKDIRKKYPVSQPLRAYRKKHGLSVMEMAKLIGVAEPTARSMENGHRPILAEMAIKIEGKTGISRKKLRPDLFIIQR